MLTVEAHVARMQAELERWGEKLDEMRARGTRTGTDASIDYHRRLDDLEAKHVAAQTKLDALKAAGTARWERFRTEIESAWSDLETAFRRLAN